MPVYKVINTMGVVVHQYENDIQIDYSGHWPGCTQEEVQVEVLPDPPGYSGSWKITKLAFLNRFTDAEFIMFDLAAQHDSSASPDVKQAAAGLRRYMSKVNAATYIDLTREDTRVGVQILESLGMLASGRAIEILDTPPTEMELWNG